MVLEAEISKIKVSGSLASGKSSLIGLQMAAFLLCPHMAWRREVAKKKRKIFLFL